MYRKENNRLYIALYAKQVYIVKFFHGMMLIFDLFQRAAIQEQYQVQIHYG